MSVAKLGCELPPGFRFHPTDEELIMCYLRNRADSTSCHVSIISEVDIYKFDPWQLPEKAEFGEREWYFFTPRDRKYPNGLRPNRAAVSGYWKATGTDKAIYSATKSVGVKKSLVFYKGRPPKGTKTDWIMHEYRLTDSRGRTQTLSGSMKLDDWVLCRVYKKRQMGNKFSDHSTSQTRTENQPDSQHLDQITQLPCGGSYNPTLGYPKNEETSYMSNDDDGPYASWFPYHFADPRIGSLNNIALNQTMSVNPNFDI